MNKKNTFSIILALVFTLNCFVFFTASATEDVSQPTGNTAVSSSVAAPESTTPVIEKTKKSSKTTTTKKTQKASASASKTETQTQSQATNEQTFSQTTSTTATQSQTTSTTVTTQTTQTTQTTTTVTYKYDDQGFAITQANQTTTNKTVQEEEEITEPTTVAKIVKDYGAQYGWLKWLSLVGMLLSIGGLIALNVMFKSVTPKSKRKNK